MRENITPPILDFKRKPARRLKYFNLSDTQYNELQRLIYFVRYNRTARPPLVAIYSRNPERVQQLIPDVLSKYTSMKIKRNIDQSGDSGSESALFLYYGNPVDMQSDFDIINSVMNNGPIVSYDATSPLIGYTYNGTAVPLSIVENRSSVMDMDKNGVSRYLSNEYDQYIQDLEQQTQGALESVEEERKAAQEQIDQANRKTRISYVLIAAAVIAIFLIIKK